MKVYLHGKDNIGWSIDSDHRHMETFLRDLGHVITGNIITADVVHSVWWNQLLERRSFLLGFKRKIIATATNRIDPSNPDYLRVKKRVSLWIAPSKRQFNVLKGDGVQVVYQPFYVNEKIFRNYGKSRQELAGLLGIDYERIKNKTLIGSFQRDTLGADLVSPKWQKGPELLLEILSKLPNRRDWLLVLAGPRRHFVISECEKLGIPYFYYGQVPVAGTDDLCLNNISQEKISLLYNLLDCYLVTSKSEGGPKAILEASFCRIPIFSTDVGLAPDILDGQCIYRTSDEAVRFVSLVTEKHERLADLVAANFGNVNLVCSYVAMKNKWKEIYEAYIQ